jgi:alanyl-tRNA synthetase
MKPSSEIRKMFFDFFQSKGHTIVESAPVVPHDDPTLLFTNAGMNQFKDIFLGTGKRPYVRAADTQKCIRVSGKHNDLEEVGIDTYHHTFFEMLGNWSFGDYFKKEAIQWAWEFLLEEAKISPDKMYATVFKGDPSLGLPADEEAAQLWKNNTTIDPSHILYCSSKDNFWEMGETGPCGPCTEIHVDRGPEGCDMPGVKGHICQVNGECARYIEIWNLVFIQYNMLPGGKLENLPASHVDTGMGFERLCALMNGKMSNYDTDLFTPIFRELEKISGKTYGEVIEIDVAFRVIADHVRALSIAISDGITPSNVGRGYVLRRLLRRAVRYGRQVLNIETPFMTQLSVVAAKMYKDIFPEISLRLALLEQVLNAEEKAFARTIDKGIKKFEELADKLVNAKRHHMHENNTIDGFEAFILYSTYGFPKDLIELMARENNMELNLEEWDQAEKEHEKASAGKKRTLVDFDIEEVEGLGATQFCGYPGDSTLYGTKIESTPLKLIHNNKILIMDKTPFYAESGGQVGDSGTIYSMTESGHKKPYFHVQNCRKFGDFFLHEGNLAMDASEALPSSIISQVNQSRRLDIMANHTATHLLHWALREVLGEHATQQGSSVESERLRFDFTHGTKVTNQELRKIENLVNSKIMEGSSVITKVMDVKAAKESGATAIFGEKYGESVRVVSAGDYSQELCGGTHLPSTALIGSFYIVEESALSAGVRRIVAITRTAAHDWTIAMRQKVDSLSKLMKSPLDQIEEKIIKMQTTLQELKNEGAKKEKAGIKTIAEKAFNDAESIDGVAIIISNFPDFNRGQASEFVDLIKSYNKPVAGVVTASDGKGGVALITFASKGLKKVHAGNLLKELAPIIGGRGGGRPDFAQGGGKDITKVAILGETAMEKFAQLLK